MSMEPKIRLKGFSGEWSTRSLKEKEFTILAGGDIDRSLIKEKGKYPVVANALSNEGIVGYYDRYYRVKAPAVSVTGRGEIGHAQARKVSFTPVVRLLSIVSNHDVDFLANAINCHKVVQESTGVPQLTTEKLSQYIIAFPNDVEEEKAIGNYIVSVDSIILSTTKKIDTLKQIKTASLQSMFPQEGESVPKVRFKGFDGEWKKDKAKNIFKLFNDRNHPELPVLSATQDRGMVTRESIGYNIFHDVSNESTYKRILPGQFVIHLRSFQGGFAHSEIEGIASPAYTVFGFINENDHHDRFWKYIFMSKDFVKRLELITYGIRDGRSISFDEFCSLSFLFPSYEEQQKIADYFTSLDKQISLQSQRLEKLKQIKAACLDMMFV